MQEAHSQLHFDIDEYGAAIDVLNAVENGKVYDIALMDICMPGVSGTDAAEEMLAQNPEMRVIFLTTSDECAVEAFAMNATHYLLKPFTQEQFDSALDCAIKKTEDLALLSLNCVNGVYRVQISEIVSIESQNHYLLLGLSIKVGASYVINFDYVRSISGNNIEMQDGAKIPVPRRNFEEVQRMYMEYCRKEARK